MRRRHALTLGGLLALATLTALAPVTPLLRASTQPAQSAHHCFWKASSSTAVLYFFGSFHVLKPEMEPVIAPLIALSLPYFQQAHTVVFEPSYEGISQDEYRKMQDAYRKKLSTTMVNTDKTIPEILSAETLAVLKQTMAEMSLELEKLQMLKPWALAEALIATQKEKLGWKKQYGLDESFVKKAKEAQKRIVGLETTQEQLEELDAKANRLNAMSDDMQERYLLKTLQSLKEVGNLYETIVKAMVACDTTVLEELFVGMDQDAQEVYYRVLQRRNQQWLEKLETFLQQEGAFFVVVGLGHLIGPGNVLHLLTERGYAVEQF